MNRRRQPGTACCELGLTAEEFGNLRALAFAEGTVIERDGLSVLGFGKAVAFALPSGLSDPAPLDDVTAVLAGIGASPATLAVGALPFVPSAPGFLHLPEVVAVSGVGAGALAAVHGSEPTRATLDSLLARAESMSVSEPPDTFRLRSARPHADFLQRVAAAVEEVRSGRLDKVVLAREVIVEANRPIRQGDLLGRLRALHPSCLTFGVDGFVGASPELLIRKTGDAFASHPLAGTAPRSGDPDADRRLEDALLASDKERREHRAVVDAIAGALFPVSSSLQVPESPEIVELRNVSHLGTRISGTLQPGGQTGQPSALALLARIHPTPAVAGTPVDVALEYLAKVEEIDRGRYAGAVGFVDGNGDGEWHLGIRSAVVDERRARLFAGVGIVADSDPAAELAETQLKLQAVLAAAVRP